MNLVSPGTTHHPVAPLFASPFLFALGPRCSRDRLQQQDAENVLRKAEQPPNCTVKQTQKQFLSLSGGNGIEVVQQVLRIQTKEGGRCSHISALALNKLLQKVIFSFL